MRAWFELMLTRLIDPNDYLVLDDGQRIGRIRLARERSPPIWLWNATIQLPGPPFGDAKSIDDAKTRFKAAWLAIKNRVGEEALMKAFVDANHANRPRYRQDRLY